MKMFLWQPPVLPSNIRGLINALIAFQSTLPHYASQKLCSRVIGFCRIVGFPVPLPPPLLLLFFSFGHSNVLTVTRVKMFATQTKHAQALYVSLTGTKIKENAYLLLSLRQSILKLARRLQITRFDFQVLFFM